MVLVKLKKSAISKSEYSILMQPFQINTGAPDDIHKNIKNKINKQLCHIIFIND